MISTAVRDMPGDVVDTLKARAEARGQSLAAYLRDLLTDEAARPPIEEVMAKIATRTPVVYTIDALRSLIAEVSSVVRGLAITSEPNVRITGDRAAQMRTAYVGLRIRRYPMQPLQRRVFDLRHNLTAYDAMYVALAEALDVALLTDAKFADTPGHPADLHLYPD